MKKNDNVILQKQLGPCKPGCEGVIKHVGKDMKVTVEITHDHECNELTVLLPPKSATYYKHGSNCS